MSINVGMRARGKAVGPALGLSIGGDDLAIARREWGDQFYKGALRIRWTLASVMPGRYRIVFFPCQLGNMSHLYKPGGDEYLGWSWARADELATIADMPSIRERAVEWSRWEGGSLIVEVRRAKRDIVNVIPALSSSAGERAIISSLRRAAPGIRKIISGGAPRQAPNRKSAPKEVNRMQTEAIYEQKKTTSGSVCYAVAEGDLGLGVLYIRKDSFGGKTPPKRLRVQVSAA